MDQLSKELPPLNLLNNVSPGKVNETSRANIIGENMAKTNYDNRKTCDEYLINKRCIEFSNNGENFNSKKILPIVPPKPYKNKSNHDGKKEIWSNTAAQKKNLFCSSQKKSHSKHSETSLDNPIILDQQIEILEHHKKQLEKKGLLVKSPDKCNLYSFANLNLSGSEDQDTKHNDNGYNKGKDDNLFINISDRKSLKNNEDESRYNKQISPEQLTNSCCEYGKFNLQKDITVTAISTNDVKNNDRHLQDEIPQSLSPVSSSYSELRRATDLNSSPTILPKENHKRLFTLPYESYSSKVDNTNTTIPNYNGYSASTSMTNYNSTQGSSAYESIYEPINPRPSSRLSAQSSCSLYAQYVNFHVGNEKKIHEDKCHSDISRVNDNVTADEIFINSIPKGVPNELAENTRSELFSNFLMHSPDVQNDAENYGICFKCNEFVLGENSGCTAMDKIYHIECFTCAECHINLQGKPFYSLDGKPFCEYDYFQTLEKCAVCLKPILERILRATGKPYHPQCFTCVICGNSLDGVPFTVDATNQNYCIEDFHKKFAPRCCVCKYPILPEPGEEETVRVVALDRSFHFQCYKCEDCGLLLSSEAEGRGCYPLDDHVLCKSCNAKRVQTLTNQMTIEM